MRCCSRTSRHRSSPGTWTVAALPCTVACNRGKGVRGLAAHRQCRGGPCALLPGSHSQRKGISGSDLHGDLLPVAWHCLRLLARGQGVVALQNPVAMSSNALHRPSKVWQECHLIVCAMDGRRCVFACWASCQATFRYSWCVSSSPCAKCMPCTCFSSVMFR